PSGTHEDRSCMSPLVALSFISFSGRGWTRKNFYAGPRVRYTRLENKHWSQVQPRNCPATCRTERAKFPRSPFLLRQRTRFLASFDCLGSRVSRINPSSLAVSE